jgi:hypothetical protein
VLSDTLHPDVLEDLLRSSIVVFPTPSLSA